MVKLNRTIRSATLIEVIISMVIITATFSMVLFVFSTLNKEGIYRQRLEAITLLQQQANYLNHKKNDFRDTNMEIDGLHVTITYVVQEEDTRLILATIVITSREARVLCTLRKYLKN